MTLPLCSGETPPTVLCPAQKGEVPVGKNPEKAMKVLRAPLLWRQDERAGVKRFQGELGISFSPLQTSQPLKRLQG